MNKYIRENKLFTIATLNLIGLTAIILFFIKDGTARFTIIMPIFAVYILALIFEGFDKEEHKKE